MILKLNFTTFESELQLFTKKRLFYFQTYKNKFQKTKPKLSIKIFFNSYLNPHRAAFGWISGSPFFLVLLHLFYFHFNWSVLLFCFLSPLYSPVLALSWWLATVSSNSWWYFFSWLRPEGHSQIFLWYTAPEKPFIIFKIVYSGASRRCFSY